MAYFEGGVSRYIKATATVEVYFPVDLKGNAYICCDACQFYRKSSSRCGLTNEPMLWSGRYVGGDCPLKPANEMEDT
jgi:hypothetical protein|nr:MAG TPA: hypothetical protein [Caudoviricetes sp.]